MDQRPSSLSLKTEKRFSGFDILAIITVTGMFCYYFYFARRGFGAIDESFYYNIVQRLEHGDRLLIDEWYLSQLSTLLFIIPYKFACFLCSGTDGIILCLRYMFLCSKALISCYMWLKLRRFRIWGLLAILTYLSFIDCDITSTFSYYTCSMDGMVVVCLILFLSDKLTPVKSVFAGFVFACVVIAEPFSAFLYLIYTLFVIAARVMSKKNKISEGINCALTAPKTWLCFTAGCVLCAIPFLAFFFKNTDLKQIIDNLPALLSDPDYTIKQDVGGHFRLIRKIKQLIELCGTPLAIVSAALIAAIPAGKRFIKNKKALAALKLISCAAGCAVCVAVTLTMIFKYHLQQIVIAFCYAPFILLSILFYLLCEKKSKPALLFLVTGILFSVCIDTCSQVNYGFGGFICEISFWISADTLVQELVSLRSETQKEYKARRISTSAVLCACFTVFLCALIWDAEFIRTQIAVPCAEVSEGAAKISDLNAVVEKGPQKGLKTTEQVKDALTLLYSDIDTLTSDRSELFYIFDKYTYLYLYANADYTCYSTWVSNLFGRQIQYWTVFPERIPAKIYIPFYDVDRLTPLSKSEIRIRLSEIDEYFTYDTTTGEAGYILNVTGVKF